MLVLNCVYCSVVEPAVPVLTEVILTFGELDIPIVDDTGSCTPFTNCC